MVFTVSQRMKECVRISKEEEEEWNLHAYWMSVVTRPRSANKNASIRTSYSFILRLSVNTIIVWARNTVNGHWAVELAPCNLIIMQFFNMKNIISYTFLLRNYFGFH